MSIEWLLENAAPVVRYRTLLELLSSNDSELLKDSLSAVLLLPETKKRLDLLKNLDYSNVHGSNSTYLENVLPMLGDFGLNYGIDSFRQSVSIDIFSEKIVNYDKIITCAFLLRAKFPISELLDSTIERINTIYGFTRDMDFSIYDEVTNFKGMPKSFHNRKVIKLSVAHGNKIRLPMIYDIVSMAEVYYLVSADIQAKIDNIIDYIISPEYDAVDFGYGILCGAKEGSYYAMGWDCKKPFNDHQDYSYPNLHRLLLYSCFPTAAKSEWFKNAADYLSQYKSESGTYIFPKDYLVESDSNWVLGSHMSLAENRRKKQWAEIESTFYMQKILKVVN